MAGIPRKVRGPTWGTWSDRPVAPERRRGWTVDAGDAAGAFLPMAVCEVE